MDSLSLVLALVSILGFWVTVVGLIKPSWIRMSSRKQAFKAMLGTFLVMFVAILIKPIPPETTKVAKAEPVSQQKVDTAIPAKETTGNKGNEPATAVIPTVEPVASNSQFKTDVEAIIDKHNAFSNENGLPEVTLTKVKESGDMLMYQNGTGKIACSFMAINGQLSSMMVNGFGDGSASSGVNILLVLTGLVRAVDPTIEDKQVGKLLSNLLDETVKTEKSATKVVNGKTYSLSLGGIIGTMFSVDFKTLPPSKENSSKPATDIKTPQPSDQRNAALKYFKSGKEKKVKDALWTSDTMFKVGVLDDGSSRDGFAQYVCEVLNSDFGISSVRVKVIDVALLSKTGEWKDLGQADCK